MKTITYTITDPRGIHARPAGPLVKLISKYQSSCRMGPKDHLVDGKSILQVMALAVRKGQDLILEFDGPDEDAAASHAQSFMQTHM